MLPTVAVIGHKKSGKTTLIRSLVAELRSRGYRVMSAKHVDLKGFTIDTKGRDTWWHSRAGANPVVCVSDMETTIIYKKAQSDFGLQELSKYAVKGTDLILLEGFSRWLIKDRSVAKMVMVRNKSDYEEYLKDVVRVLCVCSYSSPRVFNSKMMVLNAERDIDVIVKKVVDFVENEKETYALFNELPKLDCGKCGYKSCLDLARAIKRGKASLENCVTIRLKPKLRSRIVVYGKEIPLQTFVSEIVRRSILGMLSSLKGVEIKGNEIVEVKVSHTSCL